MTSEPPTGSTNGTGPGAPAAEFVAAHAARLREQAGELVSSMRELLGPDEVIARTDPGGFSVALARLGSALLAHPAPTARTTARYTQLAVQAGAVAALRALGSELDGPAKLPRKDPRFADPAWTENAAYYLLRQWYSLAGSYADELLDEATLDAQSKAKANFALTQLRNALAPSNMPALNPAVLKRFFETGGLSAYRGVRNFVRDQATNSGRPRQMHPQQYTLGKDLACTPGKVVFRNRLIELIQFEPQTEQVHEVPVLFSPPWINKYYIMDLAPGRSLIEWAVQRGHSCFVISYRNPDAELRDVTMSDYLLEGPLAALEVVEEITGHTGTNLVSLCLGGTLGTSLCAWLAERGESERVHSLTVLNTLLDFSEPGELGVLTDEKTVRNLERTLDEKGYLPADSMRNTFDLLRANDLLWNYVVTGWLLGDEPTPFDILSWNGDSTRMPAAMQSEYLHALYLRNELARGELALAGRKLDLNKVAQDTYFVSAENDHIAPWRSVYLGARCIGGTVRFTLSNAGHIAGVVNPPSKKSKHWVATNTELPDTPDAWRAQADEVAATWWEDWTQWIEVRAGGKVDPPPVGSAAHPALENAPGSYVLES